MRLDLSKAITMVLIFFDSEEGVFASKKILIKRRRENEIFLLPMDCLYLSVALWKKQRSQVIVKHNSRGVALKVC